MRIFRDIMRSIQIGKMVTTDKSYIYNTLDGGLALASTPEIDTFSNKPFIIFFDALGEYVFLCHSILIIHPTF